MEYILKYRKAILTGDINAKDESIMKRVSAPNASED